MQFSSRQERTQITFACEAAEDFTKRYYEYVDKVSGSLLTFAVLSWRFARTVCEHIK